MFENPIGMLEALGPLLLILAVIGWSYLRISKRIEARGGEVGGRRRDTKSEA
jgi:hypothetical protein